MAARGGLGTSARHEAHGDPARSPLVPVMTAVRYLHHAGLAVMGPASNAHSIKCKPAVALADR
jgi:hypothetical protein